MREIFSIDGNIYLRRIDQRRKEMAKFNVTMTHFYIFFGQEAWQEAKQCQMTKKKEKHVKNCFLLNANLS